MTRQQVRDKDGPSPRVQQRILHEDAAYKLKDHLALERIMLEHSLLPWGELWQHPVSRLHDMVKNEQPDRARREFKALYEMVRVTLERDEEALSDQDWLGSLLFAALFNMNFVSAKHHQFSDIRAHSLEATCHYFQRFIDALKDDHSAIGILLKARAAGNIVVAQWNAIPKAKRGGDTMKTMVATANYFAFVIDQTKFFPKSDTAPFNALAIASRLELAEQYPALHAALKDANPKFSEHPQYNDGDDGDFAHFRKWLVAQSRPAANINQPKRKPMNTNISKVVLIAAAILTLTGLVSIPKPTDLSPTTVYSDLRPHSKSLA